MKFTRSVLLFFGLLSSVTAIAQQADSLWQDIEYIRNAHVWLMSSNAAGLQYLPVTRISTASAFINRSAGGFVNYHQSDNSVTAGAAVESFYRFNQRVVFNGKIMYENFNGENMGGSALIDPYKNPVDINEDDGSNIGTKKLESYTLQGAVSATLTNRLTAGGSLQYQVANFAKVKDLRHSNKLLDMDVAAGVSYKVAKAWELGLNYHYIRRIESFSFSMRGNTDKQYYSLINFGNFSGQVELFTDDPVGYISGGGTRPMINNTHRLALQIATRINSQVNMLHEFSYGIREGYYGERGSSSTVFTEHTAPEYHYQGVFSLTKDKTLHTINVNVNHERLDSYQNVFRRETAPSGNSLIVYYGQRDLFKQQNTTVEAEYTARLNVQNNLPQWTVKAGGVYTNRNQTVIYYPYYRKQNINMYVARLAVERNLADKVNRYKISLNLAYGNGGGSPFEDGVYTAPSEGQSMGQTRDAYLYQEYEYQTSPRIKTALGIQYARQFKQTVPFIQVRYAYIQAFEVEYIGRYANNLDVSVGCVF